MARQHTGVAALIVILLAMRPRDRLRMLKPHELFRAQGFPQGYIIDRTANGTPLKTTAAVRMVGNSVSPPPLRALAEANLDPAEAELRIAA
ncbi:MULTISPECIES: DNA cytosine methyltransferase [unclassified Stenotrophomonas]|uniref:DNA cytosine methyltransferase n=1 Tax=unclassified Stenotrophomonas TaxID=196198 RepID=UPI001E5160DF|nr:MULTISPECIES: DNA cytosine methyltransferase [unclassified Stenotrophomonas]